MNQDERDIATQEVGSGWRQGNIGRLLNDCIGQFETRVLELMAATGYSEARMTHISLTRNLDLEGTRLTELARRASMTKQSMAQLVVQLEQLGLVVKRADPSDGRARIIVFTDKGLAWLAAFRDAIYCAEREMESIIGHDNFLLIKRCLSDYHKAG